MMKCVASGHVYEIKTVIVDSEHKAYSIVCPMMQKLIKAELPSAVKSSQQYGSSIKGVVVQTWAQGIASVSRTARMVKRFLGKAISEGTVMTILKDFGDKCLSLIPVVRNYLSFSPVKNADETGMRVDGMLHWLHTVCNDKATYLYADKKRGFDAISNDGLLIDATGFLIHDCWSSYFKLENLEHAICLQHIQREL